VVAEPEFWGDTRWDEEAFHDVVDIRLEANVAVSIAHPVHTAEKAACDVGR
jgi:hypothetical protein